MANMTTVQELIDYLVKDYDSSEIVAYTIYSEGDLQEQDEAKRRLIWQEVAPEVRRCIENLQPEIGEFIEELELNA